MEHTNLVDQRGFPEVADNIQGGLSGIDSNEDFINMTPALLITPV
ncbi:hypothetical protein [Pseudomonas migulae]